MKLSVRLCIAIKQERIYFHISSVQRILSVFGFIYIGHTSSPCGTPQKAEETLNDNGRDGLTNSNDLRVTNGPEVRKTECCGKNLEKNFNSIRLAHL